MNACKIAFKMIVWLLDASVLIQFPLVSFYVFITRDSVNPSYVYHRYSYGTSFVADNIIFPWYKMRPHNPIFECLECVTVTQPWVVM